MKKYGYVYMITNPNHKKVYVGVTGDLYTRIWNHKHGKARVLGKKMKGEKLLYLEQYACVVDAFQRQTILKHMKRRQKARLIASLNPERNDLADGWYAGDYSKCDIN